MLRSRRFWDSGSLYLYHGTLKHQIKDLTSLTFHVIKSVIYWGLGRLPWPWNLVNFPCFPVGLKIPSGEGGVYTCVCSGIPHSLSYYHITGRTPHFRVFCQPFEARVFETWRHNIIVHCRPSTVVRWLWLTYIGLTSQWLSSTQTSIFRFTLWPWNLSFCISSLIQLKTASGEGGV